ncbi:MAG: DnaJ C-terminal domain-containing protein [Bacteroidota bacterium]
MAQGTDYYQLLGVPDTASPAEIKQAYRTLARASHPDHHPDDPGAEERFKLIQRAYHILSNTYRRQVYDNARLLTADQRDASWVGPGMFSKGRPDPLASLLFGEDVSRGVSDNAEAQVRLTFDQALRGGSTEVRVSAEETIRLTVPKGVRSGLKIRVRGRGPTFASGARGDLFVTFRIEPSSRFRREGENLHIVETVSAIEAILGTTRSITSAYGHTIRVTIPAGTQPGERLRLRGQGVETSTRKGDLFVEVHVTVPRSLTAEQRETLAEAARQAGLLGEA